MKPKPDAALTHRRRPAPLSAAGALLLALLTAAPAAAAPPAPELQDALAEQLLITAIRMRPSDARARFELAEVQARLGKLEAARAELTRARDLDPKLTTLPPDRLTALEERLNPDRGLSAWVWVLLLLPVLVVVTVARGRRPPPAAGRAGGADHPLPPDLDGLAAAIRTHERELAEMALPPERKGEIQAGLAQAAARIEGLRRLPEPVPHEEMASAIREIEEILTRARRGEPPEPRPAPAPAPARTQDAPARTADEAQERSAAPGLLLAGALAAQTAEGQEERDDEAEADDGGDGGSAGD